MDYNPQSGTHFFPDIDNDLRAAAIRGVKVELLVSHWNTEKPEIHHLKSLSLVPGIEVRISTVPQASQGHIPYGRVTHSKYMIVDGQTLWLGTSNWSQGYFLASRNLELIFRGELGTELTPQADAVFERVWSAPFTAPVEVLRDYPPPRKG
jgi:HKD family nuclease